MDQVLVVGWASVEERRGGVESIQADLVRSLGRARFVGLREAASTIGVDVPAYVRHGNVDRACMLAEAVQRLEQHERFHAVLVSADAGAFLRTRAPLVCYWHNPYGAIARRMRDAGIYDRWRYYEYGEQYAALQSAAGRRASLNVAVSPWMAGYVEDCGVRCDEVVPLGVSGRSFRPADPQRRRRLRERWGVGRDRPLVAFAGGFHPVSGYEIVDALMREVVGVDWLLVFKAPPCDDHDLLGVPGVRFPTSRPGVRVVCKLERETMADVFAAADVVLCPSPIESFNLKAVEALMCDTPVVAARAGIFATWSASGPAARLVERTLSIDHDVRLFAEALDAVLGARASFAPRAVVEEELGLERFGRRWRGLMGRLAAPVPPAVLDPGAVVARC